MIYTKINRTQRLKPQFTYKLNNELIDNWNVNDCQCKYFKVENQVDRFLFIYILIHTIISIFNVLLDSLCSIPNDGRLALDL